ncbi:MAG: SIS domain-containing protein [Ardenticatenaceae bacterium]|nr:SIS domain-containing protein [Ardenticatenaceae bacterium]MCB8948518.1 SIS domain-containing protein [Ardenticatenaceae bacterium]
MTLHAEILEQTAVWQQSYAENLEVVQAIAQAVPLDSIHHAFIAARGTSDNAARYASYLWGTMNQLPVTLATPSLFSLYQQPPRLRNALVIGISQSGQSPDIVNVVVEGKRQGQPTLAITNEPNSPLAQTADFVINIHAGVETAVAATKTYTTQLLAIAMLSAAWSQSDAQFAVIKRLGAWGTAVLAQDEIIGQMAQRYRYMAQCVVLGRGYNYATAYEWSLKLKELTYVVAEPYSSADFRHGPIAIVDRGFPVMAIAPAGAVLPDLHRLLQKLSTEKQAELLIISNDEATLALANSPISLPADLPEWVSPLIGILPAQLFAYHLTRAKGYDTEAPRGLNKVTRTQ